MTCTDTSFLFSFYGNDAHSSRVADWLKSRSQAIIVSPLNRFELNNAFYLADFRGTITSAAAESYRASFAADIQQERLLMRKCSLHLLLKKAGQLSDQFTQQGGHRAFDILHVAAAIVFGATEFLTFDIKQRQLAEAAGLIVPL